MAQRWVEFENELATHSPTPGGTVSIRLPRGFRQDRDEPRLLSIAGKFGLGWPFYHRDWELQRRYVWLAYDEELSPSIVHPVKESSSVHRDSPRRSKTPRRSAKRNNIAGKRFRLTTRLRASSQIQWEELDLCLEHFGGFLIGHGLTGDTEGEGDDHLILTLPDPFNPMRDLIRLKKLTQKRGLIWVGSFLQDGRTRGLWVAPDKGMSQSDALLRLARMQAQQ